MNLSQSFISLGLILFLVDSQPALESRSMNGCVCPGDTLTYDCTVVGGGLTVWKGNAFICPSNNNEIALLHRRFESENGTNNSCTNGTIVGKSLAVEGNNYTSQLNVIITPETAGKTIMCIGDNGTTTTLIFSILIPSTGTLSLPSIVNVNKSHYSSSELTFNWSPVTPACRAIHYNILALNCGSCPITTNHTNVTCTNVPTNDSTCTFAVQTVVCGNITGNISDPISITLYTTESTERTPTDTTESMGMNNSATSRVYSISFSCLATALFMGAVTSLTVIVIFLKRSRAKIRAVSVQSNRAEETIHNELAYENVMLNPSPSASSINTQDNVAYGQTSTSTKGAMQDIPTYQNDTGSSSRAGIINTQDNVAYGRTKTSTIGAGAAQDVSMYEEVTGPLPLVSTITIQNNVAYRCTQQL